MKPPRSLWPYALIATFVIFISATIGLIVLAASQNSDLVASNYYEQEIKYQSRLDSLDRAKQLGATAAYDPTAKRITISLPAEHAGKSVAGQIHLYRPSAAGLDQQFELRPDANGIQLLDASSLQNGLWEIHVAWNIAGQDYFLDRKIVVGTAPTDERFQRMENKSAESVGTFHPLAKQ